MDVKIIIIMLLNQIDINSQHYDIILSWDIDFNCPKKKKKDIQYSLVILIK